MSERLVRLLAGISLAGALHAAVNAVLLRRPPDAPPPVRRPVRVVLPVRDEERRVGDCLAAVLDQRGVPELRVVVVDDGSGDRTAEIVEKVTDPRVRLVPAGPLPAGWLGKPHACAVGAEVQRIADEEILVFVDADVRLNPDAIAASVAVLDEHGLDLVSPWPRPLTGGLAEHLVQPLAPWLWLTTLPLRLAERSGRPPLAAANGQFLVVRRRAYDRAGGHAAVRGQVVEDVALLRAIKRAGGSGGPIEGSHLASCRMYEDWASLREGYAKSLWAAVGGSAAASSAAAAALTAVWLVPPVAAAVRRSRWGFVGYAAGVAGRAVAAVTTGSRPWPEALAHPASILLFDVLMARSVLGHRRGTLRWRGRRV